jgi:hypothetical protein
LNLQDVLSKAADWGIPILLGVGLSLVGFGMNKSKHSSAEFSGARWCFRISAIIFSLEAFVWELTSHMSFLPKIVVACMAGLICFFVLPLVLDWVNTKEKASPAESASLPDPPANASTPSPDDEGWCVLMNKASIMADDAAGTNPRISYSLKNSGSSPKEAAVYAKGFITDGTFTASPPLDIKRIGEVIISNGETSSTLNVNLGTPQAVLGPVQSFDFKQITNKSMTLYFCGIIFYGHPENDKKDFGYCYTFFSHYDPGSGLFVATEFGNTTVKGSFTPPLVIPDMSVYLR